jgi:hypothetical protein
MYNELLKEVNSKKKEQIAVKNVQVAANINVNAPIKQQKNEAD